MTRLNNTQIALMIKNALEFNAVIITAASQIYKQELKQQDRLKFKKDFEMRVKKYSDDLTRIIEGDF